MNNDLISREALKKQFEDKCIYSCELCTFCNGKYCKLIDNAPTVYPICEDKACKYRADERSQKVVTIPHELIEKLVLCVVDTVENIDWDKAIEAYKERPHGEWVFRQDPIYGGYYKCSECGEVEKAEKKFCSNCGADMRGDRK